MARACVAKVKEIVMKLNMFLNVLMFAITALIIIASFHLINTHFKNVDKHLDEGAAVCGDCKYVEHIGDSVKCFCEEQDVQR